MVRQACVSERGMGKTFGVGKAAENACIGNSPPPALPNHSNPIARRASLNAGTVRREDFFWIGNERSHGERGCCSGPQLQQNRKGAGNLPTTIAPHDYL